MSDGTIVVVNPASANGRTGRRWPELAMKLRGQIGDFEATFTKAPKEAEPTGHEDTGIHAQMLLRRTRFTVASLVG